LSLFVAVASGVTDGVMTSSDGITWTTKTTPNRTWNSVIWSPELSLFCAVSETGTGRVMTSPDGDTWTSQTSPNDNWKDITWSPELSLFCSVAYGTNGIMTSPDGITWTTQVIATSDNWNSVTWSPELSLFCVVADSGSTTVITSPDGITWTARTALSRIWASVTWSPELSLFCAVARSGTGDRVMTSSNGITWTTRSSAADNSWNSVTWSPELSLFVAVASGATDGVMTSSDGITWTTETTLSRTWNSITWSPELSLFCAVASSGTGDRVMTNVPDILSYNQNTTIGTQGVTNTIIKGNQLDIGQSSYQTNIGKYGSEINIGSLGSFININGNPYKGCGLWCRKLETQSNIVTDEIVEFKINTSSTNISYLYGDSPPTIPSNDGIIQINRTGMYKIDACGTLVSGFVAGEIVRFYVQSSGTVYSLYQNNIHDTSFTSASTSAMLFFEKDQTFAIRVLVSGSTQDLGNSDFPTTLSVFLVSDELSNTDR